MKINNSTADLWAICCLLLLSQNLTNSQPWELRYASSFQLNNKILTTRTIKKWLEILKVTGKILSHFVYFQNLSFSRRTTVKCKKHLSGNDMQNDKNLKAFDANWSLAEWTTKRRKFFIFLFYFKNNFWGLFLVFK